MGKVIPDMGNDLKPQDAASVLVGMRVMHAATDAKGKGLSLILGEGVGMGDEQYTFDVKAGFGGTLVFSAGEWRDHGGELLEWIVDRVTSATDEGS